MNKATLTLLRQALTAGDCAAALALLDTPTAPKSRKAAPVAKRPKFKGNKFADPAPLLGAAPCGCAVWLDTAVMCEGCAETRNEMAVRCVIAQHEQIILDHERRLFPQRAGMPSPGTTRPRNWTAFIFQAACRYKDCTVK